MAAWTGVAAGNVVAAEVLAVVVPTPPIAWGRGEACVVAAGNGVAVGNRPLAVDARGAGGAGTMNVLPHDLQRAVCPAAACVND